jgi:hypothetical protein
MNNYVKGVNIRNNKIGIKKSVEGFELKDFKYLNN